MSLAVKRGKARGDPGIWSTIRDVGVGFLTGGVTGGMTELGRTVGFPQRNAPAGVQINPPFGGMPGAGIDIRGPGGFELGFGIGEIPEAARMLAPGSGAAAARNGAAPPGYHWNKTGYFVKGPPAAYIAPGTKLVRNRRRNPLNPRAFDRALGRVSSAKRFAKKLGKVTIRKSCSCK
jgi:hypothetical protein